MTTSLPPAGLSVRHLHKIYPPDIVALYDVNLELPLGEFTAIIGPSGCGKTTLLKIAAGIETYQQGAVAFAGEAIAGNPSWKRSVIYQDVRLFPWLSAQANIAFALESKGIPKAEAQQQAREWIVRQGLEAYADAYPAELSGGTRQKIGVCRVLASQPDLVLCDEPFSALDWNARESLQHDLLHYWYEQRKSVLFVTHNVEEAVYLAQRVVLMSARPGVIKEIVDVPLPDERWTVRRDSPQLLDIARYVNNHIADEVRKAQLLEQELGY
ncbi:ABC transporter-related protein [Oscillochloris trichoides DG-6]|uniref:ABC transporter-related protein n=1 Tax=Oscillochloris trichoides DG-6 TaxID=765420 RepID=E1IFP9_9CHLR|nr:ABC transporter ATP-binding protein [Oscillochloris trichoides]EFO79995.1 ABC transporter-related protein [Oscillochloris trichoides DG-6]